MTTSDWINLIAAILVGGGTLFLGIMAWRTIRQQYKFRKNEHKQGLLNEVRDWIFEIQNISLEPLTADNMAFRQFNISMKYGTAISKVEYLTNITVKVFKDTDFEIKLTKVAEMLISVAVLDRARTSRSEVNAQSFAAFPGKKELADRVTGEYEQKLVELRSGDKGKDDSEVIDTTNSTLWDKYVRELANSRSDLLSRVTSILSNLL